MQERCMKIVDVNRIFHGLKSEIICLTVDLPRFESTAGKPHCEGIDVMVSPGILPDFTHRGSTKFATPNHDGVIQ
jgi:hypothetical protein